MASVNIPDSVGAELQRAADQLGHTKEEVALVAISSLLWEQFAIESLPNPAEIERLRESLDQLNRGDVVSSDRVDAFFADWQTQLASR